MLSELITGSIVLLFVMIAFNSATHSIVAHIDQLKREFHDMRVEFINLVRKLTVVESTYVTHKEFDRHLVQGHNPKDIKAEEESE